MGYAVACGSIWFLRLVPEIKKPKVGFLCSVIFYYDCYIVGYKIKIYSERLKSAVTKSHLHIVVKKTQFLETRYLLCILFTINFLPLFIQFDKNSFMVRSNYYFFGIFYRLRLFFLYQLQYWLPTK